MPASELAKISAVTPIEHLFYADDRPQHSICFFLKIRVEGQPDKVKLDEALRFSLSRHPLLRATLKGDVNGPTSGLQWEIRDDVSQVQAIWNPKTISPIHIDSESGVRLFVRTDQDSGDELLFQFHHSACDARAGIQFIEEVLTCYAGKHSSLMELDESLLAMRGDTGREGVNHALNSLRYTEQYAGYYLQKCAAVASHTNATGEFNPAVWPCFKQKIFDQSEFRRLKSRSIQKHCTVNDLILRDVMVALSEWNVQNGVKQSIRLGMPINMRTAAEGRMPAANYVSMCNIERTPDVNRDPWQLLSSISRETAYIKENRLGYALLLMAGAMSRLKGGVQILLKQKKSHTSLASAVVSNLGEVLKYATMGKAQDGCHQAGNLKIIDVSLVPPVRPDTKLAFGIATCTRRMSLSMQYDQTALSREDARSIFDLVVSRLSDTIGKGAVSGEDLKALISRHTAISSENPEFRSLPLGKHVATSARINQTDGKPGYGSVEQLQ